MSAALEAKTAMRQLASKAQTIAADQRMRPETKAAKVSEIETQIKAHEETIRQHERAMRLVGFGESLYSEHGGTVAGVKTYGLPPLRPTEEQVKGLHYAATTKQPLRIEVEGSPAAAVTKSALDLEGDLPALLLPGIVAFRREPTRVASLLPSSPTNGPLIEYVRHTGNTGAATTVAPGGAKPEIVPTVDTITANVRKIAAHIGVNDETLLDFTSTAAYLSGELERAIVSTENTQVLSGNGTAPNLKGLLQTTGIITRTQGASPETPLDTIALAMTDLRTGAAFTSATGMVMSPDVWSAVLLLKDSQGHPLVQPDFQMGEPPRLYGVPVVVTTDMPASKVLVGDFETGAQVFYRQGITIETQSTGTDWTSNITRFRGEERIALAVYRPACFCLVTLS